MDGDVAATWTGIATAIAAWLALVVSVLSLVIAIRAQRLAERQEARRTPVLKPYLVDGYVRTGADGNRVYAFLLSISNPSDIDNSVANIDLHVAYRRADDDMSMVLKVRASQDSASSITKPLESTLLPPQRVDAHQTLTGWAFFGVSREILTDTIIDGYRIVLTDTHGIEAAVEPIVVREYVNESKTEVDRAISQD